jgi:hypothetical protein
VKGFFSVSVAISEIAKEEKVIGFLEAKFWSPINSLHSTAQNQKIKTNQIQIALKKNTPREVVHSKTPTTATKKKQSTQTKTNYSLPREYLY